MHLKNRSPFARSPLTPKARHENELFIYDEIGFFGIQAEEFVRQLAAIEGDEVHIRINSPGGSVFDGQSIITAIREHSSRTVAHVDGLAASMAAMIATSTDETVMADGSFMMIHDPWSIVLGSASDMRREANLLDKVADSLAQQLARKSGMDVDGVKGLMADETWLTADEAVESGFADSLAEERADQSAAARFDLSVFANVPDSLQGEPARKDLERLLRNAGFSRSEAKAFVAGGREAIGQRNVDADALSALEQNIRILRGRAA